MYTLISRQLKSLASYCELIICIYVLDTFCTPTSAAACWVVGTSLWCFIILYLSVNTFIIDDSQPEPVQYSTIRVDNDEYIGTSALKP